MKPLLIGEIYYKQYSNRNRSFGIYECPYCNNKFEALCSAINCGDKKTCGCKTRELKGHPTHKLSKQRIYKVWSDIKQRCNNKKSKQYKNYGGRGIKVFFSWEIDFKTFYDWAIENGYKEGLTIDRINNDGNYEPTNCRWVTSKIQNCNKRYKPSKTGYIGVLYKNNAFVSTLSSDDKTVYIGSFKTALEGALARELYIIDNNLPNKRNFKPKETYV